jgi:serine/threonine protein kinase
MIVRGREDVYTVLDVLEFETPLSEVFRAVGVRRGPVILKRARPEVRDGIKQLERESELALACTMPGLAAAIERVEGQDGPWLVLERIAGPDLVVLIRRQRLPHVIVAWILREVAVLLGELHASGLVHRDLKAENVVWDVTENRPKLIDLGLACPVGERPTAGAFTEYAAAPEVQRLEPADPRSDVYSLGILGRRLLGDRVAPVWFRTALDSMSDPDLTQRPSSAEEVAQFFADLAVPEPQAPVDDAPLPYPRTMTRCRKCRAPTRSNYGVRCASCGGELCGVMVLESTERGLLIARLDAEGPAAAAARARTFSASPAFAAAPGLRLAIADHFGVVFEHGCSSPWIAPPV